MNSEDIIRAIRRHAIWVLGATMLGVLAAGALALSSPKTFQASTTLYVTASDSKDAAALSQGAEYVQSQIRSYPLLLTAPAVTKPVSAETGIAEGEIGGHVSAIVPTDSSLLQISTTADSPQMAETLASSVGKNFTSQITRLETRPGASLSPIRVTTVEPATAASSPIAPNTRNYIFIGLVGGLLIGLIIAAFRELAARR